MNKDIYLVECQELVFLAKDRPRFKILMDRNQLIELLEANYKIYNMTLVEKDLEALLADKSVVSWLDK